MVKSIILRFHLYNCKVKYNGLNYKKTQIWYTERLYNPLTQRKSEQKFYKPTGQ